MDHRTLPAPVGELALRSWAPSTVVAYEEDWACFEGWCHRVAGLEDPLEADERVVAEYVASLVRDRLAYATIRRRVAGITFGFDVVGRHRSPTRSPLVRRVVKGAARTLGSRRHRAEPLSLDQLRRVVVGLPSARANGDAESVHRDRLLLTLGWAAALRASEVVALDVDDVAFTGDCDTAAGGMLVRVRTSRGQEERSEFVAVPYASLSSACPVRKALTATRRMRSGPLFLHIDRHGPTRRRLGSDAVSRIVKGAVSDLLQLDPARYSSHSLRAGFVTEARRNGVPAHLIARHTRHRAVTMFDVYDRPGELFTQPALGGWW
ncbi:MAG: tyrosine-type recombinase/integrase [Acidimicrobiales bacterium]